MGQVRFRLSISSDEMIRYYAGDASVVLVSLEDGRRLQFPASALRPYLSHSGVQGEFVIHFDNNNKLQGLQRVGD